LHNYRNSGGRGQSLAPAGVPVPDSGISGADPHAQVWQIVADSGPAGALRARAGAPSRSGAGVGGVAQHDTLTVTPDPTNTRAVAMAWELNPKEGSMLHKPGVYSLRSNGLDGDAEAMGNTDAMLTDTDDPGESVFRSRTSELGLRPIDHPEGSPARMGISSSPSSPDLGHPGPPHPQDPDRYDRKLDDNPQRPAHPPAHHHRLRPSRPRSKTAGCMSATRPSRMPIRPRSITRCRSHPRPGTRH